MKFNDAWPEIQEVLADSFRLESGGRKALSENRIARLIAAIPFEAGCEAPMRTALDHLSTYYVAATGGKSAFGHTPEDNVRPDKRLERISRFEGGDKAVIRKGMALLTINMLAGYRRDLDDDASRSKYNPLADSSIDFEKETKKLEAAIRAVDSPAIDNILSVETAYAIWWLAG